MSKKGRIKADIKYKKSKSKKGVKLCGCITVKKK